MSYFPGHYFPEGPSSDAGSSSSSSEIICETRQIRLTRYEQEVYIENNSTGFRLRVIADSPCLMDIEIFRWFRGDPNTDGDTYDEFSGVCSAYEMQALPADEPNDEDCPKQYRSSEFDIILPAQTLAKEVWDLIVEEVGTLVRTLNYSDELAAVEQITIDGN